MMPVVLLKVRSTRLATRGTRYGQVTASGAGGVMPPGLGLGKAKAPGDAPGVVRSGLAGWLEAWPEVPGRPLHAMVARITDARSAALTQAITATSFTGYWGELVHATVILTRRGQNAQAHWSRGCSLGPERSFRLARRREARGGPGAFARARDRVRSQVQGQG